jgi:hypothetical protein
VFHVFQQSCLEAKTAVVPFLTSLFNDCVTTCHFIEEFKQAVVTPLYKGKGDSKSLDSYRGISVLPPVTKLFEKMLADQTRVYFDTKKCLFAFHSIDSICFLFDNLDFSLLTENGKF